MSNRWIHFAGFGCLGVTTEVCFTAARQAYSAVRSEGAVNLALPGHSYVWMLPIYGLAAVCFPIAYPWIAGYRWPWRVLAFTVGIFTVEFLTGWLLESLTGACPWHYDAPLAVAGYIRLDYAPFWAVFGCLLEQVFLVLNRGFPVLKRPPSQM